MFNVKTLVFFLILGSTGLAQEKNEVEVRLKKKEIPTDAKEWLKDAYETKRKVKWYYQTDGDEKVYEAKLKYQKQLHSIEFNMEGHVQNIEVQIKEEDIDRDVHQSIMNYLESTYKKFYFSKIQIQYTGEEDDLEDLIDEGEIEDIEINYEIEYYGKTDTQNELWEGLFDEKGFLIKKRIVKIKNTDNLDY